MKRIIDGELIPIWSWAGEIEDEAMRQARNLSALKFAFHHIAIMPDCHTGYGMPIGGVLATRGVVIPNAVGVDIGCGMCAVRTSLHAVDRRSVERIVSLVRERIPLGFEHHKQAQKWDGFDRSPDIAVISEELDSARHQLGTLGGGNHFIEVQQGSDGYVWFMIHSGSRNFGLKIASVYHKKAAALCEKWHSDIPDTELSFLPNNSQEGQEYWTAMNYALAFALANRKAMVAMLEEIVDEICPGATFNDLINIHHNYAIIEHHFGHNVIVHRKGATSARAGETGIIPGSQGTKSYIVRGLGNPESFTSCSHGAGRKMGRKAAQRSLSLEEERKKLDEQGIVHGMRTKSDLDEAAGAYKEIGAVMAEQSDLVEILVELSPLGVVKG